MDRKWSVTVKEIATAGMMVAIMEASKMALSFLPNIELTSFWLIMFTLFFGRKVVLVVPAFILIEGTVYGFGLWWVMYLYAWPLLVFLVRIFRKQQSAWFWAVFSGFFGLMFGALCAIPYLFIGAAGEEGLTAGIRTAFAWWVAGIPWDLAHCGGNFVLMLLLYVPVSSAMKKVKRERFC